MRRDNATPTGSSAGAAGDECEQMQEGGTLAGTTASGPTDSGTSSSSGTQRPTKEAHEIGEHGDSKPLRGKTKGTVTIESGRRTI